ncbi:Ger(x)C family spore germination protein [Paenibacillus sp. Soil724D2]|uniref:Ger(x)C family spore germination protein n=1 Tax=Paenibacillus sp. (strain Soil724D2) TaxID=1736392 RepID=UPI000714B06C|nr:Ger(x)C family spore germination protein [Paenibacillus sp. Soil724D2]KRE34286.1 hypothetical protein ASG85_13040 [Paenibacillus sp. Soil724D2]
MRTFNLSCPLLFIVIFLTGCWDRTEINDYAFWIGSSIDLNEDGSFKVSAQIAIPSQFRSTGGSKSEKEKATIVVSATGKSLIETLQNIQEKLPRRIFVGHRRTIFFGEKMARSGIKNAIDQFVRNPDTRLRTDVFMVQGGEGKDALEVSSPFNPFSAVAAVDQDKYCRVGDTVLRDLIVDSTRDGIRPSMPVIEVNKKERNTFIIQKAAMYNKNLEMVGTLGQIDSMDMFWIKGVQRDRYITVDMEHGIYSIYESNLRSHITSEISDGKLNFVVKLTGNGRILENTTRTNPSSANQLPGIEHEINKKTKEHIEKMIKKVQENYGQDVFGFGEVLHEEHPIVWKSIKNRWDQEFPLASVIVDVRLKIRSTGNIGKSLDL